MAPGPPAPGPVARKSTTAAPSPKPASPPVSVINPFKVAAELLSAKLTPVSVPRVGSNWLKLSVLVSVLGVVTEKGAVCAWAVAAASSPAPAITAIVGMRVLAGSPACRHEATARDREPGPGIANAGTASRQYQRCDVR